MSKLGKVFQAETMRLAFRAARKLCAPIKRDVVALKRQNARYKRLVDQLRKDNDFLLGEARSRLTSAAPKASAEELKHSHMSPRLVRIRRARLGLSRANFGKLLGGYSGAAVNTWETGQSKPGEEARAALIGVRKLGKREARQRLDLISGRNGGKTTAALAS